nr:putative phage minor tail protein L [uncultured Mediterranean phage uvMED]BAR23393.1 putative phage minor tail protein L [uncultured Mediterranean phage uvMED]
MSLVFEEFLNSSPFAIIELFEIELFENIHGNADKYRFYSGTNFKDTPSNIMFAGEEYPALPVEAEGFEYKGDGTLPRPTLRFANVNAYMTAVMLGINTFNPHNDLNGARVKRIRTLSRFLDSDNWQDGVNPYGTPNASAKLPEDIYYIDRKTQETRAVVEFELTSVFDMANVSAPKRQAMQNLCQWKYKSKECGYSGPNEFTADGTSFTQGPAANFAYSTGSDVLNQPGTLQEGEQLVSSNGWFKMVVERDGALNVFIKNDPTGTPHWRQVGSKDGSDYSLVLQGDGNLVLYNDKYPKAQYPESVSWSPQIERVGQVSTISRMQSNGVDVWLPAEFQQGRSGAFAYEVIGAGSYSEPTAAGQTTNATKTFSETGPYGSRSLTLQFTFTSVDLSPATWHGQSYGWNTVSAVSITGQSGLWKEKTEFVAQVTVSSTNPFGAASDSGSLNGKTVGAVYKIDVTTGYSNKRLRLKDNGRLVVEDTDGTDVTFESTSTPVTSEPQINTSTGRSIEVEGVCGKRISDCKLRFPNGDAHGGLPFGSFPALGDRV